METKRKDVIKINGRLFLLLPSDKEKRELDSFLHPNHPPFKTRDELSLENPYTKRKVNLSPNQSIIIKELEVGIHITFIPTQTTVEIVTIQEDIKQPVAVAMDREQNSYYISERNKYQYRLLNHPSHTTWFMTQQYTVPKNSKQQPSITVKDKRVIAELSLKICNIKLERSNNIGEKRKLKEQIIRLKKQLKKL